MKLRTHDLDKLVNSIVVIGVAFLVFLSALTVSAANRVEHPSALLGGFAVAILMCGPAYLLAKLLPQRATVPLLTVGVLSLYGFLYESVGHMQHILYRGWYDESVISIERRLTGLQIPSCLQGLVRPVVTEGFMFAYLAYGLLMFVTSFACSKDGRDRHALEYLLALSIANIICDVGFILIPVEGPLRFNPAAYTVPLNGGFFTMCGEWVRTSLHLPGESLPSAHCALTTVILVTLFRHNRRFFYAALPTLIAIYPATVYCRYHYLSDAVAGIFVGILSVNLYPFLEKTRKTVEGVSRPRGCAMIPEAATGESPRSWEAPK